jgi:chemosensory pili system protein ChpA (sensor histidine kinase/response regulator)
LIAWFKSLLRRLWPGSDGSRTRTPGAELDQDLCEIFYAELGEVTQSLHVACAALRRAPTDPAALKQLRRGFHTLKGSAPLIGAAALGEFCAQVESAVGRLIETPSKSTPETIGAVERAVVLLPEFVRSLRDDRPPPAQARSLTDQMRRLAV